ncbi:MAG TPA: globin-coupled sensor protein [Rhodoblastus sp.]|nr:globin-coupled sensor protein [Rhodoblastus sp.]
MSLTFLQARLEFNRLDNRAIGVLRENSAFLTQELERALDGFYSHIGGIAETKRFFPNSEIMRHAKDAQLLHWKIILSGGFDDEYVQSARRIGLTHCRLGLKPDIYLGGYSFLVSEVGAGIVLRLSTKWNDRRRTENCAALTAVFVRAAFFDMQISQGVYLEALEEMRRQDIHKVGEDLRNAAASTMSAVIATAAQLKHSAHNMQEGARAMIEQAHHVSSGSQETAANVHAVSAATTQMNHSITEIAQQARRSHEIASASAESAQKSELLVGQLADAASQIGGIVDIINGIAGKTNMLALNATIEAARAGEAGRGFAVVATEVKALAEQTSRSTQEIASKIGAIQKLAQRFAENIAVISSTTVETSAAATGIATSVEQQGAATEEISRNIIELSSSVASVARSIEAVTQAAEASGAVSAQVLDSSSHLNAQAQELNGKMSEFLEKLRAA